MQEIILSGLATAILLFGIIASTKLDNRGKKKYK